MLTNRNQLPPLQAVARPSFEQLWANFKSGYLAELAAISPDSVAEVEAALSVEGDLFPKMGQMFCQYLIAHMERINEQARQMLPGTARAGNLDHVVAFQSLERQVIDPGDSSAFPPVPPVAESDDHLLLRFLLAPHAPAAGSRLSYRYHCLTLGQRPLVSVDKPSGSVVVVTYTYPDASIVASVRDGNGIRTAPGEVTVTILSNDGSGVPEQALLDEVESYFARDDVRPETDLVIVQPASILNYQIDIVCDVKKGPDTSVLRDAMLAEIEKYKTDQHVLSGVIKPDYLKHLMYKSGASNAVVNHPAENIVASVSQAPYCTEVNLVVNTV
jgi:phage-related baseplate assembly protein